MSIAKNLRAALQRKGISINAIEKMAGVKPGSVQNILYGRSKNPGIDTLVAIANALNIPLDELRDGSFSFSKISTAWDIDLYTKSTEMVRDILHNDSVTLNKKEFLDCVDKIYEYSKESLKDKVDLTFAKWFVQEKFSKQQKHN